MRDPVETIISAIERDRGGIAIIWCPDFGLREWLVGEVESVAPIGSNPVRTDRLEEALAVPASLVLLVPRNERDLVLSLDGLRDQLLERTQPIVLFLLRDGDGRRALAEEAPSLAQWVRGSDADPEAVAQIDVNAERDAFVRALGKTPEDWLSAWRAGVDRHTSENLRTAYRAMLIEAP
jgi:hypothetical protein